MTLYQVQFRWRRRAKGLETVALEGIPRDWCEQSSMSFAIKMRAWQEQERCTHTHQPSVRHSLDRTFPRNYTCTKTVAKLTFYGNIWLMYILKYGSCLNVIAVSHWPEYIRPIPLQTSHFYCCYGNGFFKNPSASNYIRFSVLFNIYDAYFLVWLLDKITQYFLF